MSPWIVLACVAAAGAGVLLGRWIIRQPWLRAKVATWLLTRRMRSRRHYGARDRNRVP
jgi:hypothetical protein